MKRMATNPTGREGGRREESPVSKGEHISETRVGSVDGRKNRTRLGPEHADGPWVQAQRLERQPMGKGREAGECGEEGD